MKCSQCGKEFDAEELKDGLCAECRPAEENKTAQEELSEQNKEGAESQKELRQENEEGTEAPETSQKKSSKKKIFFAAAVIALAAAAAAFFFLSPKEQKVSAQEHENPTALAYITEDEVALAKGTRTVSLYRNEAKGGTAKEQVSQLMGSSVPYIGEKNYLELANGEIVYIPLSMTSMQNMTGKLCVRTASGDEKVLDEEASVIYCHGDNSVYYNKMVDDKLVQTRYLNGELTPMSEIVGKENIVAVKASADDSLLQVLELDENQNTVAGGYFYNGKLHLLDPKYMVFDISDSGKDVFVMESDEQTGLVTLYRVKDLETEELEKLGSGMTEAVLYEDGSLAFLADCNIEANPNNPIGSIYLYQPETQTVEKQADNAVALVESEIRNKGWMNENGRDITTSELSRDFGRDKPLFAGQVHYIDAQGNLCASSAQAATVGESGLQGFVICEDFYNVDDYSFNDEIVFATGTKDYLYWSRGPELFRYRLGSMEQPEVIPLDESVEEKVEENAAQVGYLTSGSGDIIEETQESLVLKNFSDYSSITLLQNVGTLTLAGLNNDGTEIYFISEDGSLYAQTVTGRGNPKRIDSNVVQAQATSEGLYYVVGVEKPVEPVVGESGEEVQPQEPEYQYNLMFREYGKRKSVEVAQNVNTIAVLHVAQ